MQGVDATVPCSRLAPLAAAERPAQGGGAPIPSNVVAYSGLAPGPPLTVAYYFHHGNDSGPSSPDLDMLFEAQNGMRAALAGALGLAEAKLAPRQAQAAAAQQSAAAPKAAAPSQPEPASSGSSSGGVGGVGPHFTRDPVGTAAAVAQLLAAFQPLAPAVRAAAGPGERSGLPRVRFGAEGPGAVGGGSEDSAGAALRVTAARAQKAGIPVQG